MQKTIEFAIWLDDPQDTGPFIRWLVEAQTNADDPGRQRIAKRVMERYERALRETYRD